MWNQASARNRKHLPVENDEDLTAAVMQLKCKVESLAKQAAAPRRARVGAAEVEAVLAARRRREHFFDVDLFSDPAWEMLLELYALELRQRRVAISKLCLAAGVPASTALRWITKMEHDGLLVRKDDPLDGRRSWIQLSDAASESMRRYFEDCQTTTAI